MKNNIWLYLLLAALIGSACQKEEAIIEPELNKQPTTETTFGDFSLEVLHLSDHSAEIRWTGNPSTGRYDAYLDGVLVKTGEVKHELAQCVLSNLSPEQTYHVKIRWICSDDEVRFAQTSFTTLPTFMLGYAGAVDVESYKYADYSCWNMIPMNDGLLYTLKTKKDYSSSYWVTLLKSDVEGNTVWTKDYPLHVDEKFSEYRDTELLADGSILLITTKRIICTTADGQTKWMHEFFEPEEKKISLKDVHVMDNGNLMVVGSSHRNWGKDDNLWEEAYIGIISPEGTLLHETFQDLHKQNRLDMVEPMDNGNFLVCGVTGDNLDMYSDGDFYTNIVDATGTILEVKSYSGYQYKEVNCSLKGQGGNFYILGTETLPNAWYDTRISIIRMNASGKFISRKCYDKRAGDGELIPVSADFHDDLLVITTKSNGSTDVLITDKECNDKYHWGIRGSFYFVHAKYEEPYLMCWDNNGVEYLYNLKGYKEYPYFDLLE